MNENCPYISLMECHKNVRIKIETINDYSFYRFIHILHSFIEKYDFHLWLKSVWCYDECKQVENVSNWKPENNLARINKCSLCCWHYTYLSCCYLNEMFSAVPSQAFLIHVLYTIKKRRRSSSCLRINALLIWSMVCLSNCLLFNHSYGNTSKQLNHWKFISTAKVYM